MLKLLVLFLSLITITGYSQGTEGTTAESFLNESKLYKDTHPAYAFELAQKAEEQALHEDKPLLIAESNLLLGELFSTQASYKQAHSHLLASLKILETYDAPSLKAQAFNELGKLYYFLGHEEKVLLNHQKAVSIYHGLENSLGVAETYGFIGHYYEKKGNFDSALNYQQKALTILDPGQHPELGAWILSNLGSIYEDLQQYDRAGRFFSESLGLNDSAKFAHQRIGLLNNLGDIAYKQQKYPEAEVWVRRALALASLLQDNYQIRGALRDLSQVYAARGQHELAYAYLDSSLYYYKKIYSEDGMKQIARLEAFFETEKKEREISLLEKDRRISQLIISLVIAGLLSSVVIGMMLYHKQQAKHQQKQALFAAQEKFMNAKLDNQNRSLTSYSLHLMEKNQLLQQLKDELKSISQHGAENPKRQLRVLSRNIDLNLSHEKAWESFRQAFEQVHPSFFKQLSQRCPGLTHAELRLAALMKMHLNSQEIASTLNISTDSLRVGRYRLRKKLKLEKETKLSSYLLAL
jgi:tetratricopeptide (TPR) repeat protein